MWVYRSERCGYMQKRTKIMLRTLSLEVFCKRWIWERVSWLAGQGKSLLKGNSEDACCCGRECQLFILSCFFGPAGRRAQVD